MLQDRPESSEDSVVTGDAAIPPRLAEAWRKLSDAATASERAERDADLERLRDVLVSDVTAEPEPADPPAS